MHNNYTIKYSKRKSLCVEISKSCEIIVRVPLGYPKGLIDIFIDNNDVWINKSIIKQKNRKFGKLIDDKEKGDLIKLAKEKVPPRVEYFSSIMGLHPTSVKITTAEKRFGSCREKMLCAFLID